jgi:dimethylargininase
MRFKYAVAKKPGSSYVNGLTSGLYGQPTIEKVYEQHEAYCQALKECGLSVTILPPDERYPDSTFTEDTAVIGRGFAVITNPGADSRKGEIEAIETALNSFTVIHRIHHITPPGTLDGGDICEAEDVYFIGLSQRTNEEGARQLSIILKDEGYRPVLVDIRTSKTLLHLKSGIAYLSHKNLVIVDELASHPAFQDFQQVRVQPHENYAANCIKVNDRVLLAEGYPILAERLTELGYDLLILDVSEFRKMDGGLSCLSLRF